MKIVEELITTQREEIQLVLRVLLSCPALNFDYRKGGNGTNRFKNYLLF